jgi:hypothetical protein
MDDELVQKSVDRLHDIFEKSDLESEWKKIQKKMEEARYNPGNVRPLADCIFSILMAARSRGFSVKTVINELEKVAQSNINKSWKKMPDGTYQAI